MRRFARVLLLLCLSACPAAHHEGDACTYGEAPFCASGASMLVCGFSQKWALFPCLGPDGCKVSSGTTACDATVGVAGQPCPPSVEGTRGCQASPSQLLSCSNGVWFAEHDCFSCTGAGAETRCVGTPTGQTADTCSPTSCPQGCCTALGECVTTRTTQACGAGGNACAICQVGETCDGASCISPSGCSPSTCGDGCCQGDRCLHAPKSPSDTSCGPIGGTCTDCSALNLVCDPLSRSCKTSAGGADGGDDCQGVSKAGHCLTSTVVEFCSVPTGTGAPSVKTYSCPGSSQCQTTSTGVGCVAQANSCTPGDARCLDTAIQVCGADGFWPAATRCGDGLTCAPSVVGGVCVSTAASLPLTGSLSYEVHTPVIAADGRFDADWNPNTSLAPGINVVVESLTGSGAATRIFDSVVTDATGHYTVKVPATASPSDRLVFLALGGDGLGIRYALADPSFGSGHFSTDLDVRSPRVWSWQVAVSTLSNGGMTTVHEQQASGALNLFDMTQRIYSTDRALHHAVGGKDVVVWFGWDTDWFCGTCFSDSPSSGFASQIYLSGDTSDQAYWGKAVIAHELGHWAMASHGTSPGEGGAHTIGVKTFPGQAWSEGWATFHSAFMRQDSVYYDRQGTMFWLDLATRQIDGQQDIVRTTAADGLLQQIDENDVAAMLLQLSQQAPSGVAQISTALSSRHMNISPWPQGYTRHTWTVLSNDVKGRVRDTLEPAPHLGDLFDALRCSGMPASFIDAVTSPTTTYPFDSAQPKCRTGVCYGCEANGQCLPGTANEACGAGGGACSVCTGSCMNGVCQ